MADQAELVVCALLENMPDQKQAFANDEQGLCAGCQRTIVFRWYSKPIKLKMCVECAMKKMVDEGLEPDFKLHPATSEELRLMWAKTKNVQ